MKKKQGKKLTYSERVAILTKMVEEGENNCDAELLDQCMVQDIHQYLRYVEIRDRRKGC